MKTHVWLPDRLPSVLPYGYGVGYIGAAVIHAAAGASTTVRCADGRRLVLRDGQTAHVWCFQGKLWRRKPPAMRPWPPRAVGWWLRRGRGQAPE